jgi:hypothetical protein
MASKRVAALAVSHSVVPKLSAQFSILKQKGQSGDHHFGPGLPDGFILKPKTPIWAKFGGS